MRSFHQFAGFENYLFVVQVVCAGGLGDLSFDGDVFTAHGFELISISDHAVNVAFEAVGAFLHGCRTRREVETLVGALGRRSVLGDVAVNGDLFALPLSLVRDGLFDQFNQSTRVFLEYGASDDGEREEDGCDKLDVFHFASLNQFPGRQSFFPLLIRAKIPVAIASGSDLSRARG